MNRAFSKILTSVVIVILVVGGFFAWQYFGAPEVEPQIQKLEIIPSQKTEEGIVYQEGAKAIVIGKNLAKVEFRQRGGGQIYTSPEGGLVGVGVKIEVKDETEKWEMLLPLGRSMNEFCAFGFNANGEKIGEICLFNVYGEEKVAEVKTECDKWREAYAEEGEVRCGPCGCKECYPGLVSRDLTYPWKTENNEVVCLEEMTACICVKCGDGICGESESWCVCPEDCEKPNTENLPLMTKP